MKPIIISLTFAKKTLKVFFKALSKNFKQISLDFSRHLLELF